jgi:hypothetical protein
MMSRKLNRPSLHRVVLGVINCAAVLSASAILAQTAPSLRDTNPVVPAKPMKTAPAKPTFAGDVSWILNRNCATCHRPGEVAPFSLLTYEDAKRRAKQIATVVDTGFMPPWKANSHGEFHDERKLTETEVTTLKRWAESGAPLGNPKAAPTPPKFPTGWKLGNPDFIASMSEPYAVGAEGRDVYRCFVVPTNFDADKFISTIEVKPGNRTVVHHVIAYLDMTGAARKLDEKDPAPGYSSSGGGPGFLPSGFLGGWAPGNETRHLPDGIGISLPKGADIVLEVHYHKSGKAETDLTQVGAYFCSKPVDKRLRVLPVINPFLNLEPGKSDIVVPANFAIPADSTAIWITPHMHVLGKSMKVTAALPDQSTQTLVDVPNWDFNWQLTYTYKQPFKLPKGSKIALEAHYDNSEGNPRNPSSPPKRVTWGEQTTDEMCLAFIGYTIDSEHLTKGIEAQGFREFGNRINRNRANPQP